MKIEHLISALKEAATTEPEETPPEPEAPAADNSEPAPAADNTVPFPKQETPPEGNAEPTPAADQTQAPPAAQSTDASKTLGAKPTTGDTTLDQPLEPAAPAAPKKTFGQRVGGFAKGVGAAVGGVAGMGRAFKKGYNTGAYVVGGPGTKAPGAGRIAALSNIRGKQGSGVSGNAAGGGRGGSAGGGSAGGGSAGGNEIAQLRQQLANINQRITRAGLESKQVVATPLTESVDKTVIDAEFDVVAQLKQSLQRIAYKS